MVIKVDPESIKRLKSQDPTVLRRVLSELDSKLTVQLKQSKEDIRYIQGFSAAVDFLSDLIK